MCTFSADCYNKILARWFVDAIDMMLMLRFAQVAGLADNVHSPGFQDALEATLWTFSSHF